MECSKELNCFVGRGFIYIPEPEMFDYSVLMLLYMLRRAKRFAYNAEGLNKFYCTCLGTLTGDRTLWVLFRFYDKTEFAYGFAA